MQHVQDNAAESVRRVIDRLHDSAFVYEMDQGTVIKVRISVDKAKREATIDFTGTSPQQNTNFNAPEPVTRAAVLYVFRVMDCASANTLRAASPNFASSRMAGYFPTSSQVAKNGDQSMNSRSSESE